MTESAADTICARSTPVRFLARSAKVSAATMEELFAADPAFVKELKQFVANGRVRVVGYAGESEADNPDSRRNLALARAHAVEKVIVDAGIRASRVAAESWDEPDPVFDGDHGVKVRVVLDPFSVEYPSPWASNAPPGRAWGTTKTLATGLDFSRAIAVDAVNVYVTTGGGVAHSGTVLKVPVRGGAPILLASEQGQPWGIAVDSTSVYWANSADGTIMKVAIGGGTPTVLASGQNVPQAVTVDASSVYWTNAGQGSRDLRYTIGKVATSGGAPVTLFSLVRPATRIAHDADHLYWISDDSIVKAPIRGGTPTKLASALLPYDLVVDATSAYWINAAGNGNCSIVSVPVGGGSVFEVASKQSARAIAVDSANVYWTNGGPPGAGTVMRAPIHGGAPVTMATGQATPGDIAVDGASVYWLSGGNQISGSGGAVLTTGKN